MKNKKVIILGIVLLVVIIGGIFIKNIIEKNNEKSLVIKLKGDKSVTLNYNEKYEDNGATAYFKKKDLSKKIKTTNNVNYKKLGTYKYTYQITYKNITKRVERKIKIVDKDAPELTLNGNQEIFLTIGEKYEELNAKVVDNYDDDLDDRITIEGEVDTNKVGEYTITYSVKDSSGNEASVTRKVIVGEKPKATAQTTQTAPANNVSKTGTTSKGYKIEQRNGIYYINDILIANKTYPLPSTYNPGGLSTAFIAAFDKMQSDAASEGISLRIISGFRSYASQNRIYNNYVARDGSAAADRYSARPGHSEHQSGLAADINSLDQSWEYTSEGKWLNNNCYKYGFIIRYVKGKESSTGYMFEPWHIRYVGADLAKILYNNGNWITLEEYLGITSKY